MAINGIIKRANDMLSYLSTDYGTEIDNPDCVFYTSICETVLDDIYSLIEDMKKEIVILNNDN